MTECDKYYYSVTGIIKCDDYYKVRQKKVFFENLLIEGFFFSPFLQQFKHLNIVILAKLNRNSRVVDH